MAKRKRRNRTSELAEDLIASCAGGKITRQESLRAVRALCRHFGGLMTYIPVWGKESEGESARALRGVVADAVGDGAAEEIAGKIMRLYGGAQVYFPMERNAFAKAIALEIYERYDGNGATMNDIAREYGISGSHAYRLWREGRREKTEAWLPFMEPAKDNNRG